LKDKILKVDISPLKASQLETADFIFRLAFGTRNALPDPMKFDGDAARIKTRFQSRHVISLAASIDNKLIGSSFGTIWGNFAWLGPLSVHPEYWNGHIAQKLLEIAIPTLDLPHKRHQALFTVAESPKHLALYRKFGFYPWFLTAVMGKDLEPVQKPDSIKFSEIPESERSGCLKDLSNITNSLFEGLDLSDEIREVLSQNLGETIIVLQSGVPAGFAICHYGPGTEATSNSAYIKFGAVRRGESASDLFEKLLSASEYNAVERGLKFISAGVNMGRREAYEAMLNRGFRSIQQGVAMHRPDEPAYDRADIYAIDDWR
jgi:hypothetical protein